MRLVAFRIIAVILRISVLLMTLPGLVQPSSIGRRSFSIVVRPSSPLIRQQRKLTEEILYQRPVNRSSLFIPKRNNRRRDLTQAKFLHRRREGICGVVCSRLDLPGEFAVGEHGCVEDGFGPVGAGLVEDG